MSIIVPSRHTGKGAWINSTMYTSIYCTISLIVMQGYRTNTKYTGSLGYNSVCCITSRIRWVSLKEVFRYCCCCFSHSAYWLPTRKKLFYTVANPARGLLNRGKRTKENVWQHTPPPRPHTARSEKININTRRIYRRYAGLGRSRVRTRIPSARRLGQWAWLRKILHSCLQ